MSTRISGWPWGPTINTQDRLPGLFRQCTIRDKLVEEALHAQWNREAVRARTTYHEIEALMSLRLNNWMQREAFGPAVPVNERLRRLQQQSLNLMWLAERTHKTQGRLQLLSRRRGCSFALPMSMEILAQAPLPEPATQFESAGSGRGNPAGSAAGSVFR